MSNLEKLKLVLQLIKEHNLTAYEIGKNTKISTVGIQKIINGETKKPNENTLDMILNFIEKGILATDIKQYSVEEEKEVYQFKPNEDLSKEYKKCLENSIEQLKYIDYLKSILRKNNLDFNE
jgi:transcriptional regulator with XRE-family HTH domain